TLALEGRPVWAVAVCTLAATIKVPAIAAAIFVGFAWVRGVPDWRTRVTRCAKVSAVAVGVAAAVTIITGFGTGWISGALFATPARVRLAITPATDLSWTLASLLRDVGASVTFRGLESVVRVVAFAATVLVALALLRKTTTERIPQYLGLALAAFALGGPAMWPWYLSWALVLVAAWRPAQRSRALIAAVIIGSFLVKPDGILALPLGSSPIVAALWITAAALAWYAWTRKDQRFRRAEFKDGLGGTRSVLAEP
ncbi:MAG TPA: hypothetical protein VMP89_08465, partial [Solirubrobacteraceae bacterium]|nr:hypothetical protein [Solirubrobacteraceae bacterium]